MQITMRSRRVHLAAVLIVLQLCGGLWALSMTAQNAETAANGWLRADARPLDTSLGQRALGTETFLGDHGKPAYYVVYLDPSGFVVVSADDRIEPIIAFADDGYYDPSPDNPLGALVTNDINGRIASLGVPSGMRSIAVQATETNTQKKWSHLIALASPPEDGLHTMGETPICDDDNPSDVRVAPLTKTKWNQGYVYQGSSKRLCYNYYTPNNYPSGCGPTAMAQLMYYHRHPSTGIGVQSFTVTVDGEENDDYSTRGGDGNGGAYKWTSMVLAPSYSSSQTARQAIGALCYDAGVASQAEYTDQNTGTQFHNKRDALRDTFHYANAISANNYNSVTQEHENIGAGLEAMLNPNLDAECPVILGLTRSEGSGGHVVVCDGYGYQGLGLQRTAYHHLNMGWSGSDDCWYDLPDIDCPGHNPYDTVLTCIYNIFPSESGEIISGRVTDLSGTPISDVQVDVCGLDNHLCSIAKTNDKGIYAVRGLESNSTYRVTVQNTGFNFESQQITTGRSQDGHATSGNQWGVNIQAVQPNDPGTLPSVLICGAESNEDYLEDIQEKLEATGQFAAVSTMNVSNATPTLAELQAFDAVMVHSNSDYYDAIALGDVMADYVDNGGGVVCTMFESGNSQGQTRMMQGRWDSGQYYAIPRDGHYFGTRATLGTVHEPGHPIMQRVSNFDGGSRSFRPSTSDITPGAIRVADWSDGRPLVATKIIGNSRRADLGFYPVSSDIDSDWWDASTDGALLMANALTWAAGGVTSGPQTLMPIPEFDRTFSLPTATRGYWFTAPSDFRITGLRVPDETGHGLQNVEVVRFGSQTPPVYSSTTNDFVSLARFVGQPSSDILSVSIAVSAGDVIAVLGAAGTTTMHNSYGPGDFASSIDGHAVTLTRMGMSSNLYANGARNLYQSPGGSIGRVELWYAGETNEETVQISGHVYRDYRPNEVFDESDPRVIANATITWWDTEDDSPGAVGEECPSPVESVTSDSSGDYQFRVPHGWSGRVVAARTGFGVGERRLTNVTADRALDNPLYYRATLTLSGDVYEGTSWTTIPGATVRTKGVYAATGQTDSNGHYSIDVPYGYYGCVEVSKQGYWGDYSPVGTMTSDKDQIFRLNKK